MYLCCFLAPGCRPLTRKIIAWGPAVAWAVVLFALSALPGSTRQLAPDLPDKVLHFIVYSVMGATLAHARYHGGASLSHGWMIALGALYAATDEWHQAFVPRRTPSFGDWMADLAGVCVGYAVAWLVAALVMRRFEAATKGTTG